MSLPPQIIRVKRKASEDAPVSFLRVQENKRHRSEAFVYRRQGEEGPILEVAPLGQRPIIHASRHGATPSRKPEDRGAPVRKESEETFGGPQLDSVEEATSTDSPSSPRPGPRRFHMSRADLHAGAHYPSPIRHGGILKKRSAPALFVERKSKRIPSTAYENIIRNLDEQPSPGASSHATAEAMDVDVTESKKYKKPGLAKLAHKDGAPPKAKAALPPSMLNRWNVDLDQLTADMNAFALEQIGLNLQQTEREKERQQEISSLTQTSSPRVQQSRFKPKPPAKRYAERHPEVAAQEPVDSRGADQDAELSDTDDEGYIIETYVRVPASTMEKHNVSPQNVGLLVFDAEPDIEFFYGEGSDSEDEWAEDEEDENAENYYTADYPDEEVASDDEFGHNAYAYRNGNASDLEEYDITNDAETNPNDELADKTGFKAYIGRDGHIRRHL
ncbi:hypothetical protein BX600DRAFT_209798 [Xylariales sp. PMI_506]|nr:hypothetical protein BX600DRAFT_209798 [Xylariales sp. PMI_506]